MPRITRKMQKRALKKSLKQAKKQAYKERKQAQQKRLNTLASALGITAAMGHTNIVPTASALSKTTRSNYLIKTLRNKQIQYEQNQQAKRFDPPNRLHEAIQRKDVDAVKLILQEKNRNWNETRKVFRQPKISLENQLYGKDTPLELALGQLHGPPLTPVKEAENKSLVTIIQLLLDAGAKVRKQGMYKLWKLFPRITNFLLKNIPKFRELTVIYRNDIRAMLNQEIDNNKEKQLEYMIRGVPIPRDLTLEESNLGLLDYVLFDFLRTYDPNTGQFYIHYLEENINDNNNNNNNNNHNNLNNVLAGQEFWEDF